MARVLLVSSNTATEPYPVYPIGMSVVAAALEAAGHTVHQHDMIVSPDLGTLADTLESFRPDMTGISLRNVDNVDSYTSDSHWYLDGVRRIVHQLRDAGQTVILGGPGYSLMPEAILEFTGADYGIAGEGEHSMVRVVHALEQGHDVRKITFSPPLQAQDMISPLWESSILAHHWQESGIANLQSKRGCNYGCSYCSYPSIEGTTVRPRPVETVIEEMTHLHEAFGIDFFFFTDSVFNDADENYLDLAEAMVRNDLPIQWSGFFQPTRISQEALSLLKRSGLSAMEIGTDASSNETLKGLRKPFRFEDVIRFNELCVAARIPCAHYIIFGGPEETETTLTHGLANLDHLQHCVILPFSGIRLHAGTALYDRAIRENRISATATLLKPTYYFSPHIDRESMNTAITKACAGHRTRIFPPSAGAERMDVLRRFGNRGLLWDSLVTFPEALR